MMVFAGLVGCATTPEQPAEENHQPAILSSRFEDPFIQPIPGLVTLADPDASLVTVKAMNHTLAEVVHALNRAVPAAMIELDASLESGRRLTLNAETVPWREALKDIANLVDAEIHQDLNGRPVLAGPSRLLVELNDEPVIVGLRTIANYARRRLVVLGELSTSCRFRRVGDWRVILTELLTQEGLHARVRGDALIVADRPVMLGAPFSVSVLRFGSWLYAPLYRQNYIASGVRTDIWLEALARSAGLRVFCGEDLCARRIHLRGACSSVSEVFLYTALWLDARLEVISDLVRLTAPSAGPRVRELGSASPVLVEHGGERLGVRFEAYIGPGSRDGRPLAIVSGRLVTRGDRLLVDSGASSAFFVDSFSSQSLVVAVQTADGKSRRVRRVKLGEAGAEDAQPRRKKDE